MLKYQVYCWQIDTHGDRMQNLSKKRVDQAEEAVETTLDRWTFLEARMAPQAKLRPPLKLERKGDTEFLCICIVMYEREK